MDEVRGHFESEARDFDRIILALIPEYPQMLEALVAALPFERASPLRVIDLGCGTGTLSREIVNRFPNARITCVDIAENMIALARSKLGHHMRVEYVHADFESFEFKRRYDAAVSSLALHHLRTDESKRRLYRHIYQSLRPGGVFYNADVTLASGDFLQSVYLKKWIAFMRRGVSQQEIEEKWIPKYEAEDHPTKLTDQLAWLIDIGFADVDVIWKYYNFAVYGGIRQKD